MPDINAPYPYFANPSKGVPLANGYIYIGLPDLDPTIPANQVTVTAKQEDGTNVPLVQPIRTNAGGLPTYNGGVVQLQNLVTVVYSIQVLDASMVPIYYQAQAYGIPSLGSGGTPTALTLLDGTAAMPSLSFLNNLDTGLFYVAPNELHVSIDGQDTAHFRTDVTDSELRITSPSTAATTQYFGDGVVDAFRTGVAGGLALIMDDAARDLIIGTSATERLRITDLGSITSGGLATATVQPGGLDLQQSGTGFIQGWRSTAVSTTIPGTGAPDSMYGWVQPVDVVGGFNVSGASGNLVGLVMTGYAGVVSTGVQTAPVMVDGRISGGGSIPAASNVFGVANNGTPVFAVLGDGSISPNPVNNIDDLLITGSLATGGASLNTAAAVNGGVTIGQTALADGYALVAQSADVAHGMTSFLPTNSYLGLGSAESDGGASVIGVGGTGTALDLTGYALTANTGTTSEGVIRLTGWKKDGILAQPLAATETLFSLANGNSEVLTVLGDGTLTAVGGLTVGLTEIVTSLSDSLIHRNPNTVQPFTGISTDPDIYGLIRSNLTVNGGYRVFGFAGSTTAAYRVDAYTAAPASGFGLDSPIRFTAYKSNGGTGSATIAAGENVFSVWNQSANCLLNITGNGNQVMAGSLFTGAYTPLGTEDPGSLTVYTGTADGVSTYWLNADINQPYTSVIPQTTAYGSVQKRSSLNGGLEFRGFSISTTPAMTLRGYMQTPDATNAVFDLNAFQYNGATGGTTVATNARLLTLRNAGADVFGVMAQGRLVTGGETAPDCSPGGATFYTTTTDGITAKDANINHGATSSNETDTYMSLGLLSATSGGFTLKSYGNVGYTFGQVFDSYVGGTNTLSNTGPFRFRGQVLDGANNLTAVPATHTFCSWDNNGTRIVRVTGDGTLYNNGLIATGGETAPDVDVGGICLQQGGSSGNILTGKSTTVVHPFTSQAESDTYVLATKWSGTEGGAYFRGYTETDVAIAFGPRAVTPNTSTNGNGVVVFTVAKSNGGTGIAPLASNENALSINNNNPANQIFLLKAGGDLYIDGGLAVGGGTDLLNNYTQNTWTPVIADAATGGNLATFTNGGCTYTRIGREVIVRINVTAINTTGMTGGNTLFLRGLPFASAVATYSGPGRFDNIAFANPPIFQTAAAQSYATLVISNTGAGASNITVTALTSGTAAIRGTFSYYV